jgi:PAS domain S-box-containing protein
MVPYSNLVLLLIEVWFLGGFIIILHGLSKKYGLTALLVFMGGITAAIQLQSLGWVYIEVGWLAFNLDSHILLPIILFGLLIIYVVNGSLQARGILLGMVILTILVALFQVLLPIHLALPGGILQTNASPGYQPRILAASVLAFSLDLVILILVYQATSNIRNRFPSRFAAGLALLSALWSDAIIFPVLAFGGDVALPQDILSHLAGKTIAGLALFPLMVSYLKNIITRFPDSAATVPRPALDFFTTTEQIEQQSHHHFNLLRTLSEINKLVAGATDEHTLLQKACQLIAESRDYGLVWIARIDGEQVQELVWVGPGGYDLEHCLVDETAPCNQAMNALEAVVLDPILASRNGYGSWQEQAIRAGFRTAASFPMRHAGKLYGVLNVYLSKSFAIARTEVKILEDMADDLAYALVSIQAREQQAILQTAAETMQDGLIIADFQGKLIYTNSIVSSILGTDSDRIIGLNITDFLSEEQQSAFQEILADLVTKQYISLEFDYLTPRGRMLSLSVHLAVVPNEQGQPNHIVANIRDITPQQQYEEQLLALNRLTTELVQIRKIPMLLESILHISEELLGADASLIYTVDAETKKVMDIHARQIPEPYVKALKTGKLALPGDTVLRTLKPVFMADVGYKMKRGDDPTDGIHKSFWASSNIHSVLILPIWLESKSTGVLILGYHQPQFEDENRVRLGMTLAQTLAIIIQNARLSQSERHQHQLSEALIRAAASLNASLDLEQVFDEILKQVVQVVSCDGANFMMIAEDQGYVHRYRGYQDIPGYIEIIDSIRIPISTHNIKTSMAGEPVLTANTETDPNWEIFPGVDWIKSNISIPLKIDQEVVGFLNVDSQIPDFFTEETVVRLQTFAVHAAIAVRNANLYQQLQAHAAELEARVKQRTEELLAAKEHIEGILASVPDAVFVVDPKYSLVRANAAGKFLLEQARRTNQDLLAPSFIKSMQERNLPEMQNLLEVDDRSYQGRISEILLDDNRPAGHVIVFRDVTRFRELDQLKSQFISDVSHELRTPLTNLTLYLGFLENNHIIANQSTYLDILNRETERLTHLIEDLLAFSRIQMGKIAGEIQPVDVNQLVHQLAVDRAYLAARQDIHLAYDTLPDLPPAMAEPNWLSQALSNLLTNAFNYTPAGGNVYLETRLVARDRRNWVAIQVRDTGFGIGEEETPYIFERFYRGAASKKTGADGTGLGLAISKELVTRMGGEISFESVLDQGSSFTIWLHPAVSAML